MIKITLCFNYNLKYKVRKYESDRKKGYKVFASEWERPKTRVQEFMQDRCWGVNGVLREEETEE